MRRMKFWCGRRFRFFSVAQKVVLLLCFYLTLVVLICFFPCFATGPLPGHAGGPLKEAFKAVGREDEGKEDGYG